MSQPDFELHQDATGSFFLDGPGDYMDARGIELMNAILDQSDVLLDQLLLRHTNWQQAVLRRFQLDYANWKGGRRCLTTCSRRCLSCKEGDNHAHLRRAKPSAV